MRMVKRGIWSRLATFVLGGLWVASAWAQPGEARQGVAPPPAHATSAPPRAAARAQAARGATAASIPSPAPLRLGEPLSAADVARLDTSVFPDGRGLPPGRGTAAEGEPIYRAQCAGCHGAGGIGGTAPDLAGGTGALNSADPDQTIGLYWPYATTLFDFTRRSMPMAAPWSLTPDQTYAVTAYLLQLNGIVGRDMVLNATTLPAIHMPNRDGFDQVDASATPARQRH